MQTLMCKTGSGFLTRTAEYMPTNTNSHSEMIASSGVRESGPGQRINVLKYEFVAPEGNFLAPPGDWLFTVEQDVLPGWWTDDPVVGEARAFAALERWWREKFVENAEGAWHCEGSLHIDGQPHEALSLLAQCGYIYAGNAESLSFPLLAQCGYISAANAKSLSFPLLAQCGYIYAGNALRNDLLATIARNAGGVK